MLACFLSLQLIFFKVFFFSYTTIDINSSSSSSSVWFPLLKTWKSEIIDSHEFWVFVNYSVFNCCGFLNRSCSLIIFNPNFFFSFFNNSQEIYKIYNIDTTKQQREERKKKLLSQLQPLTKGWIMKFLPPSPCQQHKKRKTEKLKKTELIDAMRKNVRKNSNCLRVRW